MNNIIFFAGISNIFLGIVALRYGKISRSINFFATFCFITGAWVIFNFLEAFFYRPFLLRSAHGLSSLVMASLAAWAFVYSSTTNDKNGVYRKVVPIVIYLSGILLFLLAVCTNFVVSDMLGNVRDGIFIPGSQFCYWAAASLFFYLYTIFLIVKKYFSEEDGDRKKDLQLIYGLLGFGLFLTIADIILPSFGILEYMHLGGPSSLIFVIFTFITIVKNEFLDIKILFVQVLAIAVIAISLVEVSYSTNLNEIFLRMLFFIFVSVASVQLVRSVELEIRRKMELEIVNMRLVKLDETKSEFVSMASHQLRTPLTSSNGFMSMIREGFYGEVPQHLKEPLERVHKANLRLLGLVEDMLNVSRIESGKMVFNLKKEDIVEVLRDIVEPFDIIAQRKDLGLKLFLPKHLPPVNIDKVKISEALSNLVDNAIKYSKVGTVTVKAELDGTFIKIVVQDTGIGIAKEDLSNVFEKFSRGTNQNRLTSTGTGLGLYFGKKVIEANYGMIRVESDGPGKGSRFVVEIPVA